MLAADDRRAPSIWIAPILALAVLHAGLVWGYTGVFYDDTGRWLHEVDRYARGEAPYVDYYWPYPPLSLWLLGGVARGFGSRVEVVWAATSLLYLAVVLGIALYVRVLLPPRLAAPAALAALLLAVAYAQTASSPLPLGTYTPAAPVGFLALLAGLLLLLYSWRAPGVAVCGGVGALCGACLLAKQDFWAPALYVMGLCSWRACTTAPARSAAARVTALAAGLALVFGAGLLSLQSALGWSGVAGVATGFGQIGVVGGRSYPSWERITREVAWVGLALTLVMAFMTPWRELVQPHLRRAFLIALGVGAVAAALFVAFSFRTGLQVAAEGLHARSTTAEGFLNDYTYSRLGLVRGSVYWFLENVRIVFFPALLPLVSGLAIWLRRSALEPARLRILVLALAGFCATLRLRRGLAFTEWFHFAAELPLYVLVLLLFFPRPGAQRRILCLISVLFLYGAFAYWQMGAGPLTRSGILPRLETAKGTIRNPHWAADAFRAIRDTLDRRDPGRARPLFCFGSSGGINYFLDRRNPTPLTEGFRLSAFDPQRVIADLRAHRPAPFLVDTSVYARMRPGNFPSRSFDPFSWELRYEENYYTTIERRLFEPLLTGCAKLDEIPAGPDPLYAIHDCDAPDPASARLPAR